MEDIKIPFIAKEKSRSGQLKLKDFLCLVKNKRNRQYSFTLKKRAMASFGLSPKNILNINIIPNKKPSDK